jgi:hydrogenase maturation protease
MGKSTVILGIGNPTRRDDALGIHVARRLRASPLPEGCVVGENPGEWLSVVERIVGHDRAILVDAAELGKPPGTIVEISLAEMEDVHGPRGLTTHGPGLAPALRLARELGFDLPDEIRILAVQVADVRSYSEECSPQIDAVIDEVCARLIRWASGPA